KKSFIVSLEMVHMQPIGRDLRADCERDVPEEMERSKGEDVASFDQVASVPQENRLKKANLSRQRQRQELEALRVTAAKLQAQLNVMKSHRASILANATPWKRLAMRMRAEKGNLLGLNEFYRARLQDHIAYIESLQIALAKRPCYSLPLDDELTNYSSSLPSLDRFQAIKAITSRQYQELESAFIAGGLIDCSRPFTHIEPRKYSSGLVVEAAVCAYSTISFPIVTQTAWSIATGSIFYPTRPIYVLEAFDNNVVYTHEPNEFFGMMRECRNVVERFIQPHRQAIVFRSILHDDKMPLNAGCIANQSRLPAG
ncbi:unnamed protein product, partial [Aphanomyces euteiches]